MTTETYIDDQGRLRESRVRPDAKAPFQVAEVISLTPVVVEVLATGRRAQLYKWVRPLNVPQSAPVEVGVGDLLLVAKVEQGLIAMGEVV